MKARLLPLLALLAASTAGCFGDEPDARAGLVPYPRLGDVATYEVEGAYVEFGRWENGHAFLPPGGLVRFSLSSSAKALDAARAVHPAFRLGVESSEGAGFVRHADKWISPEHQAIVQAYYPHSQDQGTLSFDERGYPWLFGASVLFGSDLSREDEVAFALPDNLGTGETRVFSWRVDGTERVEGVQATRLVLEGAPGVNGTLWMEPGSPWPVRARLEVAGPEALPHVRIDGPLPAAMDARRQALAPGGEHLPARNRGATFTDDTGLARAPFDGEKPPDGEPGYVDYLLEEAVRDARLLDRGLATWLAGAQDPRLYRATYLESPPPAEGVRNLTWLVAYVDASERYYTTQVYRLQAHPLLGVPVVNGSGPSEPPRDPNHGWFPASAVREDLVPLSEGARLVRDAFGAQRIEIFLRSFAQPAGYSYFIDGGFEGRGRYTVVLNPATGLIENATGPVTPLLAAE